MALTLLLVDDDDGVHRAVQRLARALGHVLRTARNVAEALALLDQGGIDAVLADLHLEGDSGLALLDLVRARHPAVGRVLVSGGDAPLEFPDEPPRQFFLSKPFGLPELQSLCEALSGPWTAAGAGERIDFW